MKISFSRVTSSGRFIPEVDGLRFVAIAVVVIQHTMGYLSVKVPAFTPYLAPFDFFYQYGILGVPLFFVISGFVLSLPFARHRLLGSTAPSLQAYYLRRISRLEPPYLIALTLLFLGTLLLQRLPAEEAISSYWASFFYVHNIIYPGQLPFIMPAAWSLEVEVQFYLLAPLLSRIFTLKNPILRRAVLIIFILLGWYVNQNWPLPFLSVYNYISYFLTGFLLTDVYVCRKPHTGGIADSLLALAAAAGTGVAQYCLPAFYREIGVLICLFVFFYEAVLRRGIGALRWRGVTAIGGMCYSIYLLHFAVISAVGSLLLSFLPALAAAWQVVMVFALLLLAVLLVAGVYFLLIERPSMQRGWYRPIFQKITLFFRW